MSPLSSNTLFHFTSSSANLVSILETEFRPHYALEDYSLVVGETNPSVDPRVGLPMVSFCDIPLSQTHAHMETYGRYCIGLAKTWGMSLRVSPVLYTYPRAATTDAVIGLHVRIEELEGTVLDNAPFSSEKERFLCFTKPYQGRLPRHGDRLVRFYDEREWRYVPPGPWPPLTASDFDRAGRVAAANHDVSHFRLSFNPSDIRYLVVATEDEILGMVEEVRRIKSPRYSSSDIDILCTRIIAADQIAADF